MRQRVLLAGGALLALIGVWFVLGGLPFADRPADHLHAAVPALSPTTSGPSPYAALSARLLVAQRERGTRAALTDLAAAAMAQPGAAGVCHAVAHDLGRAAYRAADAKSALAVGSDVCGGGFIHGVIELALADSPDPERDLLRLCAPVNSGSCFHGLGHGAMLSTGFDVDASVDLCRRAPTRVLIGRCAEGVFMQLFNAESAGPPGPGSPVPLPDLAGRRCLQTDDDAAAACWFYAPNSWLAGVPDDFAGALAWCRAAATDPWVEVCARGVGSRTVKRFPGRLAIGEAVCSDAGALRRACLGGMASYWSVHSGEPPVALCARLARLEAACRAAVEQT